MPDDQPREPKQHTFSTHASVADGHSSQQTAFHPFFEAVERHIQPEGRAKHLAGMHRYLCTPLPSDVTLADLVAGWQILAQPHDDTNSEMRHRRATCGEFAAIAAALTHDQGHLLSAVSAWQAWLMASQSSANPRLAAMRTTFARELGELQAAAEQTATHVVTSH